MPGSSEGKRLAFAPGELAKTLLARGVDPRDRVETVPAGDAVTQSGPRPAANNAVTVDASTANAAPPVTEDSGPGRYQMLNELGKGGMGRVDEVFDRVLGRPVAQKRLLRVADNDHATMLIAEAQVSAQLEHPAIVPVYDLDAEEGRPFYTMRVVRGRSLREVLEGNHGTSRDQVPLAQLLGILRQVCLAVDYAHSRGVVHRDLKPDNVVVGEFGEVYVVDWGIAHLTATSDVKRSGYEPAVAGTPAYMPPEQLLGEELDARTDVFALGVMLYEILAGARPFADESIRGVMGRRVKPVERAPSQVDPDAGVPSYFDDLTLACLAPSRSGRPGRARFVANAIDQYLDQERTRAEHEREAIDFTNDGEAASERFDALSREARELEERSRSLLADAKPWHDAEAKAPAWDLSARASELAAEAARERARAGAAFTNALGRLGGFRPARRGLAHLYFHELLAAEAAGDEERVAQCLDLARAYDDGALALELRNEGELDVTTRPAGARLRIARYRQRGPLLVLTDERDLGTAPTSAGAFPAGSYLVTAELGGHEVRYPLVLRRARHYALELRLPASGEVPEGMVLVPGGPFSWSPDPRSAKLVETELPDFAIGRFPVTLREYGEYLADLAGEEQERRTPVIDGQPGWSASTKTWNTELWVSGDALRYLPAGRELDLPVVGVRWSAACAYATWLAQRTGRPYRLPTDAEWDKAMRGADGRPFSMATRLDPAFAKLRESRPTLPAPEPVGAFAVDESPYGVRDLCGGVGDWTATMADGLPAPRISEVDDGGADYRVVVWRGGSWSTATATSPMRYTQALRQTGAWIGMRLALSFDGESSRLGSARIEA